MTPPRRASRAASRAGYGATATTAAGHTLFAAVRRLCAVAAVAAGLSVGTHGSGRAADGWAACRTAPEPSCLFEEATRQALRIDDPIDQAFALFGLAEAALASDMAPAARAFAEAAAVAAEAIASAPARGVVLRLLAPQFDRLGVPDRAEELAAAIAGDADRDEAWAAVAAGRLAKGVLDGALEAARRILAPTLQASLLAAVAAAPQAGAGWRALLDQAETVARVSQDPALRLAVVDAALRRGTVADALAIVESVPEPALRAQLRLLAAEVARDRAEAPSAAALLALAFLDAREVADAATRDALIAQIAELRAMHGDAEVALDLAARIGDPLAEGAAVARILALTGAARARERAAEHARVLAERRAWFRDPDILPRFHATRAELAAALGESEAAAAAWQEAAEAALSAPEGGSDDEMGLRALLALARLAPNRAEVLLRRLTPERRGAATFLPAIRTLAEFGAPSAALDLLADVPPGPARWQLETDIALLLAERGALASAVARLDAIPDVVARTEGLARLAVRLAPAASAPR